MSDATAKNENGFLRALVLGVCITVTAAVIIGTGGLAIQNSREIAVLQAKQEVFSHDDRISKLQDAVGKMSETLGDVRIELTKLNQVVAIELEGKVKRP